SITAKAVTVTADPQSKTYGDADPELTWQVTAGSLVGLDAPTGSLNRETGENAGAYAISQGNLDFGNNYAVTFADSDLNIIAKMITVTADDRSKTYGDADPDLTWQVTAGSLVGLDAPTGTPSRAAGEDAGDYAISQGSLDFGDNYTVTFVGNDLAITARPITVTADVKSKIYGNTDPELTWQLTVGSLIGADAPTGTLSRVTGEDVGEYAIEQGSLDFGDNYAVSFISGDLTISARPITVLADSQSKTYGDADPDLTWQVTAGSLVGLDAPTGSLNRETGENVGDYAISQDRLDFGGNYAVTFVGGDLTIASRSLTIRAVSCSKTYGDADPSWQVVYENLASWDSETVVQGLSLARAPGEAGGSYVISPSGATAENYTVIMLSGTVTIDKRPLTITAAAQSKEYGTADPALSYALTAGSLIGDDSLSGEPTRETGENVGSYAILQNSLTAGGNYQITYVGAELTITPYAEPLLHGSVANGHDPDNSGQISFVAEADDGFAFTYWSDGHTVFSTNPVLTNPVGGIAGYHPVIWPVGPLTDLQVIGLSAQGDTSVLFLNGIVRMVLPAHVDPEAVIAVTACDDVAGQNLLPSGMAAAQPFFCFLRSENLVGERVRIEIDLAQAGIALEDAERESLTLYRWNEDEQIWKTAEIASQGVDVTSGILWAEVEQFSTYGLFYSPQLVQTGEPPFDSAWLLILVGGCLAALVLARKRLFGLGGRSDA
ncbi:MAG: hypothetical protein GX112_03120, partial [Clostridiaceae bacterium]|nr:hypothetical protein [Clostridiaceae bacterium]